MDFLIPLCYDKKTNGGAPMIIVEKLTPENFNVHSLDDFSRYQVVT